MKVFFCFWFRNCASRAIIWNEEWWRRKKKRKNGESKSCYTISFWLWCQCAAAAAAAASLLTVFYLNRFWRLRSARAHVNTLFQMVLATMLRPSTTTTAAAGTLLCFQCVLKWPVTRVDIKIRVNAHDRQHTVYSARNANRGKRQQNNNNTAKRLKHDRRPMMSWISVTMKEQEEIISSTIISSRSHQRCSVVQRHFIKRDQATHTHTNTEHSREHCAPENIAIATIIFHSNSQSPCLLDRLVVATIADVPPLFSISLEMYIDADLPMYDAF